MLLITDLGNLQIPISLP